MSLNSQIAAMVSLTRLVTSQRANAPRAIFACTTTNLGCFDAGSTVRNLGVTTRSASTCVTTVLLYSLAARLTMRPDDGSWSAIEAPQNVYRFEYLPGGSR